MSSVTQRRAAAPVAAPVAAAASDADAVPTAFRSNESREFFVLSVLMLVVLLCISAATTYLYFRPAFSAAAAASSSDPIVMSGSASAALFEAVSKENLEGVDAALANGDNANALNAQGQAPLHVIVTKSFRNANTFPIILSLLAHKADINLSNKDGVTPIQVALQSGWQDTAAFLFEQGAAFDANMRKTTKISCPDCKRVDATWAAADYDRSKIANYEYANKQWNRKAGAGGKL